MDVLLIYAGLFASAFLAATILPAQSELGLAALLSMGTLPAFWLIAVASIGNILGAVVNWVLGQKFEQLKSKKWFPVTASQLEAPPNGFSDLAYGACYSAGYPLLAIPSPWQRAFSAYDLGCF